MLEIKAFYGKWKKATIKQAENFYKTFSEGSTAIKWNDKCDYFNKHHIRGGRVMMNGKVEIAEE